VEANRPDRVQIEVADQTVDITWDDREALLEKLRDIHGRETIIAKFNAVGENRAIVLDPNEWDPVRSVLQAWERDASAPRCGIEALLSALVRADQAGYAWTRSIG
jgi:hypothetical protein